MKLNVKRTRLAVIVALGVGIGGVCYMKIWHDEAVVRWRITCVGNLHRITGAKDCMATEQRLIAGTVVEDREIGKYIERGWPACPAGGKYTANPIGKDPTCSITDHSLSQ